MNLPQFPTRSDCTLCDLHKAARTVGVPTIHLPGSLAPAADVPAVVVCGQNPGAKEDDPRFAIPFIGKSGQFLRNVYLPGISLPERSATYLSNAARCGPDSCKREGPYNKCIPYLLEDLWTIASYPYKPPMVLLLLGAPAVGALTRILTGTKQTLAGAFNTQGASMTVPPLSPGLYPEGLDIIVFSTFHPAYVMARKPNAIHDVSAHLQLLSNHLDGIILRPPKPTLIPFTAPEN